MFARLTLPRLPVDVVETVMIEGRSLCAVAQPQWDEVFLLFIGYRAARWRKQGRPELAQWLTTGLPRSPWGSAEGRASVLRLLDDEEALRDMTEKALEAALIESSRLGFWVNLGISHAVQDGGLWFEVRHADGIGSQMLRLGTPDDEPGESVPLCLEVREDVEVGVQMFGPMLSALCFGRAMIGVQMPMRPARMEVKLQLFGGEEEQLTAAAALVKVAALAEETALNIMLF